jgi:2-dehydro-3-deoxyphosphooctonate aldolase (KDO 8-P synthase)
MNAFGNLDFDPGKYFFVIAGPCVIENEQLTLKIAEVLANIHGRLNIPIVFKASFDKANRTSIDSFRGPGLTKGLAILSKVKLETGLPILSDIHTPDQAEKVAEVLDIIQIPAFLSRQTDLLVSAAKTGKIINIKKGQFQSPEDMQYAIGKILNTGNNQIFLTERGTSFGYNDLVVDMRSILRLKRFGFPVVFDATHSAQFPSKDSGKSGGDRSLVPTLARAAIAAGSHGVFLEVHPDPEHALCDGPNSLYLDDLEDLIQQLRSMKALVDSSLVPAMGPKEKVNHALELPRGLLEKLRHLKLIIFDVDGILTSGQIVFGSGGLEIKYFHVRDGHGIKIAIRHGLEIAFVTGRSSEIVARRAQELGVDIVYQGMKDKRPALDEIIQKYGLEPNEIAVMGDDIVDIPLMRRVGVSFTVPEAPQEVLAEVDYVTNCNGGKGAGREIIDLILKAQGKWPNAMERYYL